MAKLKVALPVESVFGVLFEPLLQDSLPVIQLSYP